ncbi:sensor domain-containing diguanylate cyclase [Vibrio sp. RE86]|uniref:sensor domain-containing diguanylate cyclase n=1 Tax=Vibrio sp. RE86 TaxID=2607605 RepID=UPI0014934DFA|nr:GGDEF domain-containing protein [Vibrio sp. RE86]NOH80304.1 sensor domain-containing diguanylate cyclase [Vibrio sp. RE86]
MFKQAWVSVFVINCLVILFPLYSIYEHWRDIENTYEWEYREGAMLDVALTEQAISSTFRQVVLLLTHLDKQIESIDLSTNTGKRQLENLTGFIKQDFKGLYSLHVFNNQQEPLIELGESVLSFVDQSQFSFHQLLTEKTPVKLGTFPAHPQQNSSTDSRALIATSIIDNNGSPFLFVIGLSLQELFPSYGYSSEITRMTVNEAGEFISTGNSVYEHFQTADSSFAARYPQLWQQMQEETKGSSFYQDHWYSYLKVTVPAYPKDSTGYIVSKFASKNLDEYHQERLNALTMRLVVLLFLDAILILLLSNIIQIRRQNTLEKKLFDVAVDNLTANVILNKNGKITRYNEGFRTMFDLHDIDLTGKAIDSIDQYSSYLDNFSSFNFHFDSLEHWESEILLNTHQSGGMTALFKLQSVKDEYDETQYVVLSFTDISERKVYENQLKALSEKDAMTQVWNRRKFDEKLQEVSGSLKRYPDSGASCLAILDIDHFKGINDKYGHLHGDSIIKNFAQTMEKVCRETDHVSRLGGEEFAIIFSHTHIEEACIAVERIRQVLTEAEASYTFSAGIATITSDTTKSFTLADEALYLAKNSGRNRTCLNKD